MLKISLLLLFLLPLSYELPIEQKSSNSDDIQPFVRALMESFIDETISYARNDTKIIYLNITASNVPFAIGERVRSTYAGKYASVTFKICETQWTSLCKHTGNTMLRFEQFQVEGITIKGSIYCVAEKKPIAPTETEEWQWYYLGIFIVIVIGGCFVGFKYYKTSTNQEAPPNVQI